MSVIITGMSMPESCLHCTKRKVIYERGERYQMCGLNEDGYLLESWFKTEDLVEGFKSSRCPLKSIKGLIEQITQLPTQENAEGQDMYQAYDVLRTIKEYCEV